VLVGGGVAGVDPLEAGAQRTDVPQVGDLHERAQPAAAVLGGDKRDVLPGVRLVGHVAGDLRPGDQPRAVLAGQITRYLTLEHLGPIEIIADGSAVVVRDRSLDTQDFYPLSQTPLRYLLADHIDLLRDTDVVSVSSDETFITVVIEETKLVVGTNRLMLMFDAKNLQLKQWTVTDPQGLDTTVAVYNLDSGRKPDPNLFVINYQPDPRSQMPQR